MGKKAKPDVVGEIFERLTASNILRNPGKQYKMKEDVYKKQGDKIIIGDKAERAELDDVWLGKYVKVEKEKGVEIQQSVYIKSLVTSPAFIKEVNDERLVFLKESQAEKNKKDEEKKKEEQAKEPPAKKRKEADDDGGDDKKEDGK